MTYAFIQKSCIWLLSIVPFSVFSYVAMRGHGPHPTGASVLSIFYCMLVLAACMYLAEQWVQLWNLEDQEDRDARQAKVAAEQARQDAWLARETRELNRERSGYTTMLVSRDGGRNHVC